MAWKQRSRQLELDIPRDALAAGCGISGDSDASWLVFWCGSSIIWFRPGFLGGDVLGGSSSSHTFEDAVTIVSARPLPAASVILVIIAGGQLRLLYCHGTKVKELPVEAEPAFDVWPVFDSACLVVSSRGSISQLDLERDLSASPIAEDQSEWQMWATSLSRPSSVDDTAGPQAARILAMAGKSSGRCMLKILHLRGLAMDGVSELVLPDAEVGGPSGTSAAASDTSQTLSDRSGVSAIAVGFESLTVLLASGSILLVTRAAGSNAGEDSWAVSATLPAWHVAGLRLCAAAGLNEAVLESDSQETAGMTVSSARALHLWEEDELGVLFQGCWRGRPAASTEFINVQMSDFALSKSEAHRMLHVPSSYSEDGQGASWVACCGSAGHAFLMVSSDTSCPGLTISIFMRGTRAGSRDLGSIQNFQSLFKVSDLQKFVEGVLEFDPFPEAKQSGSSSASLIPFGCDQVRRLLEAARARLEYVLSEKSVVPHNSGHGAASEGGGNEDGWDDFDFDDEGATDTAESAGQVSGVPLVPEESAVKLRVLLRRVKMQQGRLQVFMHAQNEISSGAPRSLIWHSFRETEASALMQLARQMAAEQCIVVLEALFTQQPDVMMPHWSSILSAFPETIQAHKIRRILPVPADSHIESLVKVDDAGISWCIQRAKCIIECTGLCQVALELLRHAIHVIVASNWPEDSTASCTAADLPSVTPSVAAKFSDLWCLYGMFRLCVEYEKYCKVALREFYRLRPGLFDRASDGQDGLLGEMVRFSDFWELEPRQRAQLVLRHSTAETIVQDAHEWALHVSVEHCLEACKVVNGGQNEPIMVAASRACNAPVEEALMEALLGCLGGNGWDLASFRMMAAVVEASRPDMPPERRIIRSPLRLLEFILGTVYSEDQRCHALDIFDSVDTMYSCIPNKDAEVSNAVAERWKELQKQADQLEMHLNCIMVLKEYKIGLSLSFADMCRGCTNEPIAERSLWNLFRVLSAKYRPALFWGSFSEKLFYLHASAFAAVDKSSVYGRFVRILVDQDHFAIMQSVTDEWARNCGAGDVAISLVDLAQELVNSSPALRHESLEKARRVLKCVPSSGHDLAGRSQSESDFIKACELLHDLVNFQPKSALNWVRDLRDINPVASLSQVTSSVGAVGAVAGKSVMTSAVSAFSGKKSEQETKQETGSMSSRSRVSSVGFHIDGPMQLRLQLFQPLRVITDLLQYNPYVITRTSDVESLCTLLGLAPSSPLWAEVMAMCASTNIICGNREEALNVTEKLLANSHPAAWKLTLALASESGGTAGGPLSFDNGSPLLADAAKVCPAEELPHLLKSFQLGSPLLMDSRPMICKPPSAQSTSPRRSRGYNYDSKQSSSLLSWTSSSLGFESSNFSPKADGMWRGLSLWQGADDKWQNSDMRQKWAEELLTVDRDAGIALLDTCSSGDFLLHAEDGAQNAPQRSSTSQTEVTEDKKNKTSEVPKAGIHLAAATSISSSMPVSAPSVHAAPPELKLEPPQMVTHIPKTSSASSASQAARKAPSEIKSPTASAVDRFPIDFEQDSPSDLFEDLRSVVQTWPSEDPSGTPAQTEALAALKSLADDAAGTFADHEKAVFQNILPSLRSSDTTREAAMQVLGSDSLDMIDESPARVLLCRRVVDMCEEVMRAQGHDECPENHSEPVPGMLTSTLSSLYQACPELDLTCQGSNLVDEVLRCAGTSPEAAQKLMHAIAGVVTLQEAGLRPSVLALKATKQTILERGAKTEYTEVSAALAVLVSWLEPQDLLELVMFVMNDGEISRLCQMEVLGHIRTHLDSFEGNADRLFELRKAVHLAEVLSLLRSVFDAHFDRRVSFPIQLDVELSYENARQQWKRALLSLPDGAVILPCVEPMLEALEAEA